MDFDRNKNDVLKRKDKSLKGSIDSKILQLVEEINSLKDYFTTSSCSGRILVIRKHQGSKKDAEWLFLSHDTVDDLDLGELPEEEAWFKMEPMILHIACRNIDSAKKLLAAARESGIKRSGIIAAGENPVLEIIGSQNIETVMSRYRKMLFGKDYLKVLIESANFKMQKNHDNIKKLYNKIKKLDKELYNQPDN